MLILISMAFPSFFLFYLIQLVGVYAFDSPRWFGTQTLLRVLVLLCIVLSFHVQGFCQGLLLPPRSLPTNLSVNWFWLPEMFLRVWLLLRSHKMTALEVFQPHKFSYFECLLFPRRLISCSWL